MDEEMLGRVRGLIVRAQARGVDPAEVLDREGLLLTPRRFRQVRGRVLGQVADELETLVLSALPGGRVIRSGEDVRGVVVGWLRWLAESETNDTP